MNLVNKSKDLIMNSTAMIKRPDQEKNYEPHGPGPPKVL